MLRIFNHIPVGVAKLISNGMARFGFPEADIGSEMKYIFKKEKDAKRHARIHPTCCLV